MLSEERVVAGRWQARWGECMNWGLEWDTSASRVWPEGFGKVEAQLQQRGRRSWQQTGVSGLLNLVLRSLWVYSVNSCPSLFQMVTRTKKIFVGGLSVNTTVEDVKQYFEQFGKVSLLSGVGSKLLLLGQKRVFCTPVEVRLGACKCFA